MIVESVPPPFVGEGAIYMTGGASRHTDNFYIFELLVPLEGDNEFGPRPQNEVFVGEYTPSVHLLCLSCAIIFHGNKLKSSKHLTDYV